jgi:hypothetical protein
MAGLESLRTPDEVAELRGLSINQVLGLASSQDAESSAATTDGAANGGAAPDGTRVAADAAPTADEAASSTSGAGATGTES